MIRNICIFCGSSPGTNPEYMKAAVQMGNALADNHIGLVYGGANIGLMGTLAKTVLSKGGKVTGIMPENLVRKEVAFKDITEFTMVASMHERKALMEKKSDAFIAMPGGFGTLDEIFEIITWAQLQLHMKPVGFLNVAGYYDKLFEFINHAIDVKFIGENYRGIVQIDSDPEKLIGKLKQYKPVIVDKAKLAKAMNRTECQ